MISFCPILHLLQITGLKLKWIKQHGGVAKRLFNNHCFQVTSLKSSGKQEMACLEVEAI